MMALIEPVTITSLVEQEARDAAHHLSMMVKERLAGHYWIMKTTRQEEGDYRITVEVFAHEPQIPFGTQCECEEVDIDLPPEVV